MNLTLHCPSHGDIETIEVPDHYAGNNFQGEVRCNPNNKTDKSLPLKIRMYGSDVVSVERG